MDSRDFVASVSSILLLMALAALAEIALPIATQRLDAERRRARVRANLSLMAVTFLANWGITAAAALLPRPASPLSLAMLPTALEWLAGIVLMDFAFGYVAHRSMHAVPLLWRFHRVHHADAFVDVTTTYRTHPVEQLWRYGMLTATILVFAVPPGAVVLYRVLSTVNAILEHANIRVQRGFDRLLSAFWVTPNMHKVHHSRDPRETDTNYGNLFSFHDRLLRTFTPTERAFDVVYGLDGAGEGRESATALLAAPFAAMARSPRRTAASAQS
jgi:sterol desaturase/sphingolipid hydroxylase (fatty acid hydroxylase superfamily)